MDKRIVDSVSMMKFPQANIYYEKDSADGYAFLGCAYEALEIDSSKCFKAIKERNYTLNSKQIINGATVSKESKYIYTLWACIEYLLLSGNKEEARNLMGHVEKIGSYPNGMYKYCSDEINLIVPNVTSAAALLYSYFGNYEKASGLVSVLRVHQLDGGNWNYITGGGR